MSGGCTPGFDSPNLDPALSPLEQPECSLVDSLAETVDEIRQLNTDFGLRPYRVFSVLEVWSGGEIGRGTPVTSDTEIVPTPLVDIRAAFDGLTSGGRTEKGTAKMSEISMRYTEDDIQGLFKPPALPDRTTYIEIRLDGRDGASRRRRFTVRHAPYLDAENFQWEVRLLAQSSARERNGATRTPRMRQQ